RGPPVVFPRVVPHWTERRGDLTEEQIDVLQREFMRHRAELQQDHEVADAQVLARLLELIAHRGWTATDDKLVIGKIFKASLPEAEELPRNSRITQRIAQTTVILVARWAEPLGRDVQELMVEVFNVSGIVRFGAGIGLRYGRQLQEGETVRSQAAALLLDHSPIAVAHGAQGGFVPEVAQEAVAVVVLGRKVVGTGAARAGDPDGRMGLLDRPWPQVHHGQLEVLTIPGKDLPRRPGF